MKYLIPVLLLFTCLFSCSKPEELRDSQDKIYDTVNNRYPDFVDPKDMDLAASLELASYMSGRTLLNNIDARNYIIDLSIVNNGVLDLGLLLDETVTNSFSEAFYIEFNRLWSRPESGGFNIEPDGYKNSLDNVLEGGKFKISHYEKYLIFLNEINCLELYFPVPLNINANNERITVVIPRLYDNENANEGGELYKVEDEKGNEINAGNHIWVSITYLNNLQQNDDNVLILRPHREAPVPGMENDCEYPYEEYPVNDFEAFLNIN